MAKKAAKKEEVDTKEPVKREYKTMSLSEMAGAISKQYGEGILIGGSRFLDEKKVILPVSPKLDMGLNGGIPEGSWVILSGNPKTGKSTLALDFAATCQKPEYGSRPVVYLNIEGRLKEMNMKGVDGLITDNEDMFQILRSARGNILSAEKNLNIISDMIRCIPNLVVIIDSTSALCSEKEQSEDVSGQTRSLGPKILANFCRTMGTIVPVQNTTVIMIQHLIANTSGYGPKLMEDSGRKVQYQVDVKLVCKGIEDWEEGDKQIGQKVHWDIVTSALGPPGALVDTYLRYGHGIDKLMDYIELGLEVGLIAKGGAWYTLSFLEPTVQMQGMYKLYTYLKENPEAITLLQSEIKKVLS